MSSENSIIKVSDLPSPTGLPELVNKFNLVVAARSFNGHRNVIFKIKRCFYDHFFQKLHSSGYTIYSISGPNKSDILTLNIKW